MNGVPNRTSYELRLPARAEHIVSHGIGLSGLPAAPRLTSALAQTLFDREPPIRLGLYYQLSGYDTRMSPGFPNKYGEFGSLPTNHWWVDARKTLMVT